VSAQPTPRRLVALWALVALLALWGLVAGAGALRQDHPATGPLTPEAALPADAPDPLRDAVDCPVPPGREGQQRPAPAAGPDAAVSVTSNELHDCPATFDGRVVRYDGEVVGALLDRGDGVWVQLNDDVYADQAAPLPTHRDFRGGNAGLGVLLPADAAADIAWVGGPGRHGDLLEVVGRFHRVDAETGEVAIIRAEQVTVVRDGRPLQVPPSPARRVTAVVAAVVALGVVVAERRLRSR
jgi:hypothetical protein